MGSLGQSSGARLLEGLARGPVICAGRHLRASVAPPHSSCFFSTPLPKLCDGAQLRKGVRIPHYPKTKAPGTWSAVLLSCHERCLAKPRSQPVSAVGGECRASVDTGPGWCGRHTSLSTEQLGNEVHSGCPHCLSQRTRTLRGDCGFAVVGGVVLFVLRHALTLSQVRDSLHRLS